MEADEAPAGTAHTAGATTPNGTAVRANGLAQQGAQPAAAVEVKEEPADESAAGAQPTGNGVAPQVEQSVDGHLPSWIWKAMHRSEQQPEVPAAAAGQQQQPPVAAANGTAAERPAAATLPPKLPQQGVAPNSGVAAQVQAPTNGKVVAAGQGSADAPSEECVTGQTVAAAAAIQQQVAGLQHALAAGSQQQQPQLEENREVGQQPSLGSPQAAAAAADLRGPGSSLLGQKRLFEAISGEAEVPPSSRAQLSDSSGGEEGSGGGPGASTGQTCFECEVNAAGACCMMGAAIRPHNPRVVASSPHACLAPVPPHPQASQAAFASQACRRLRWREPGAACTGRRKTPGEAGDADNATYCRWLK